MLPAAGAARTKGIIRDKDGSSAQSMELLEFASTQLKEMYAGNPAPSKAVLERMLANIL
jgi:hypothetical protein